MDIDLLRMLAASRSLNLSYNFSSLKGVPVLLWEPAFALRRKGGPMLTSASILPLVPSYLEMEGLNTSSNSRLRAMNLS